MKNIYKVKMIAILASVLVGCASQTEMSLENSNQEKYNKDSIDCEKDTQESGFYGGVIGKQDMDVFFKKCLAAKGWKAAPPTKPQ